MCMASYPGGSESGPSMARGRTLYNKGLGPRTKPLFLRVRILRVGEWMCRCSVVAFFFLNDRGGHTKKRLTRLLLTQSLLGLTQMTQT